MTRGWAFTLVDPNVSYNLWTDLIFPLITADLFVPKTVLALSIYFPILGPNSLNNGGNYVSVIDVISNNEIKNLISDAEFKLSSNLNSIDLTRFKLKGSAANVQVEVSVISL